LFRFYHHHYHHPQVLAYSLDLIRAREYRNTRDIFYMNVTLFEDQQAVVAALQVSIDD
jgi:DNA topoisomerase VI subunit A